MTDSVAVIEYGSHAIRAGLAYNFPSDQEPRLVLPAVVRAVPADSQAERPADASNSAGEQLTDAGELRQVVEGGNIVYWPGFESVMHYILYNQLGWQHDEEGSVIMPEPLFTSRADREQLTQLMFEEFNMTGFFLCDQPILSLYAVGKITGTVVDIGHAKTDIAAVAEGQVSYHCSKRLSYGGRDVDRYLQALLDKQGTKCSSAYALQKLKEACTRLPNPDMNAAEAAESEVHKLPDGQSITVREEGQQLGEALLQPRLLGLDLPDLPSAAVTQIMQHPDGPTRKAFAENVLVCGGGSAVTGLGAAVVAEMQSVSTPSLQPALCNCPDYMPEHTLKHSSWMGAAILSKMVFQQNQHVTKLDYDEAGPAVVHKKCS